MDRGFEIFLDVQRGLPRQGPGDDECTLRALAACAELPAAPRILDIGCGPGMQTLALARALEGAQLIGLDLFDEYLEQLQASAEAAGVAGRLQTMKGDMNALPFPADSFDLVWSEGAAYIMGFAEALEAWCPLVRRGGYLAISELVWLQDPPPEEAARFFEGECPAGVLGVEANLELIRAAGYEVAGHFTLPPEAWWAHYYRPLEAKLPALRRAYAGDEEALEVVEMTAREIEIFHRFKGAYSYEFFVMRRP